MKLTGKQANVSSTFTDEKQLETLTPGAETTF